MNTNGIGLGLMIAQQIVDKFDGKICFNSEYGQGSCFQFTFKLQDKTLFESPLFRSPLDNHLEPDGSQAIEL